MKNKKLLLISTLAFLIPIILSIIFYTKLPEQIPIHWNAAGVIDGYASKPIALFALPAFLLLMHFFVLWMMDKDPKHQNIPKSMYRIVYFIMPSLSIIINLMTINASLPNVTSFNVTMLVNLLVGVLFLIVGNYLPKCKQSYTVGIKTPWALDDEDNWNKTHRLAGFLWIIGGLLMIITAFLSTTIISTYFVVVILIMALVPYIYSYLLYKKKAGN